jgi:hypothetical protein
MHRFICSQAANTALFKYYSKRRARFCPEYCDLVIRSPRPAGRRGDYNQEYNKKAEPKIRMYQARLAFLYALCSMPHALSLS